MLEHFKPVFPAHAERAEVHVLERAQYYRYAKHENGKAHHSEIQLAVGKAGVLAAYEQKVRSNRRGDKKRIVSKAVIEVEPVAPAVEYAELFARRPENKKELIHEILRGVRHRTAEKHRFVIFVKASSDVHGSEREQKNVHENSAPHGRSVQIIKARHTESHARKHGKPRNYFNYKIFRAVELKRDEEVKYVQLRKKLNYDFKINVSYFL